MESDRSYLDVRFGQDVWHDEPYDGRSADFFDRCEEKKAALELLTSVETRRAVWLVGERRAGKTSMLRLLLDKCRKPDYLTFEVPWQAIHSPLNFYREYLSKQDEVLGLKPREGLTRPSEVSDSITFWQALDQRKQHSVGKMLVVGLDELDSILSEMNLQEKREFIGVLNQLVDTGQKLIVATTSEPSKVEWLKASPLASRSRAIVLCPFLDKDIDTMIDAYLNDCSPEIREKIHEWSGNWPNYAKAILYYLLKIKTYEPDFFDTAIHEAIKVEVDPMGQHLFREHWNDDERRALLLLVLKDVVSDLDLPNVKAHTAFLRLVERGYLLEDAGQYRFRVKLIAEWLRGWSHLKLYIKELHLEEWIRIVEDPWHHKSGEISIPVTQDDLRRRGF